MAISVSLDIFEKSFVKAIFNCNKFESIIVASVVFYKLIKKMDLFLTTRFIVQPALQQIEHFNDLSGVKEVKGNSSFV